MNRYSVIILLTILTLLGCDNGGDNSSILRKYVAIGDSLTQGVQSGGIVIDFQENSFPILVARQIGLADTFEQPLVARPGFSVFIPDQEPLTFENGQIVINELQVNPINLFINSDLDRPYDNLGISGSTLFDVINTEISVDNPLFLTTLRLRGTQLEQAVSLNPSLISLWIGNNNVLSTLSMGGDENLLTPADTFQELYREVLEELLTNTEAEIVVLNIPDLTALPFVNFLDRIFSVVPSLGITTPTPTLFDESFDKIDFGGFNIPLLLEETDAIHLTFIAFLELRDGIGVPDAPSLELMGFSPQDAAALEDEILMRGLIPTGIPLGGNFTLTSDEIQTIAGTIESFNQIIADLAGEFDVSVVDVNSAFKTIDRQGIDGLNAEFVIDDPLNTAFSLDGVHPNNAGYAIIANLFIQEINASLGLDVPLLNTDEFRGQYAQ